MTKETFSKFHSNPLKKDDILYFLHIPKTAGSSTIYLLNGFFNYSSILTEQTWNQLLPVLPKDLSKYKFVSGHYGYGFYRHFPKIPKYITMLRDPLEQSISNLEMLRREKENRIRYDISEDTSFEELVKTKVPFNQQTQFIAIDADVIESVKSIDLKDYFFFSFHHVKEYSPENLSNPNLIDIAKKHLSEFAFVGLTEKFEESFLLLCYTFDWLPILPKRKINVGKKRLRQNEIPKDTLEIIKERTNLDSQLYEYGKELFEKRYLVMVENLKENYYDDKISSLTPTEQVYEMLKKQYKKKNGQGNFIKNYLKFNFNKLDFILRYGWKTRVQAKIIKKSTKTNFSK